MWAPPLRPAFAQALMSLGAPRGLYTTTQERTRRVEATMRELVLQMDVPIDGRPGLELVDAHAYATGAALRVHRPRKG